MAHLRGCGFDPHHSQMFFYSGGRGFESRQSHFFLKNSFLKVLFIIVGHFATLAPVCWKYEQDVDINIPGSNIQESQVRFC